MAEKILAIFDDTEEAQTALAELRREGFASGLITVMSDEPLWIEGANHETGRPSRIGLFAVGGGLVGAAAALLLTIITSRSTGLVTGGMPIVAPWAFGIVVFEMIALGAILATLVRMIYESGLARRRAAGGYDDKAIAEGRLAVLVECSDAADRAAAERVLAGRIAQAGLE